MFSICNVCVHIYFILISFSLGWARWRHGNHKMDETNNFSIYQACNAETVLSVVSNYKMCPPYSLL